ncbi:MAG: outer membrane protein assembly factor BamB [Rhodoferax sp.]
MVNNFVVRLFQACLAGAVLAWLVACSGGPTRHSVADLGPDPALLGIRSVWTSNLGVVDFSLEIKVKNNALVIASSDGTVASLDARTGAARWRLNVGGAIAAGVGSDGQHAAVVTRGNELVVLEAGRELWRTRLTAQVFTSPLVAGARVFVLGADRTLSAFDAQTGRKIWQNQRPGEALVLRQAGVLIPVQNTLVVGSSGRLLGLNPLTGAVLWDAAIATPRGTNDIERLVDLVAGVSRDADVVCVRAFQAAAGCVETVRGKVIWRHAASGSVGLHGDDKQVYAAESDGRVLAWRRADGEQVWEMDRLRNRQLSAPLLLGRSIVVGDEFGLVHLISRADGSLLARLATDGSAIAATPVVADGTLVVVTRKGGVFGFVPE